MKIAVPDEAAYAPLIANAEAVCTERGWSLVRAPIEQCGRLLLSYAVDAALVSPLGYGRGVGSVDYRIVPKPFMMLHDFTNVAGITFTAGATAIRTVASNTPEDFLVMMGMLILSEKLDAELSLNPSAASSDCTIDRTMPGTTSMMDVSEEWADLTDAPLPVALWACRIEADLDAIAAAVAAMADPAQELPVSEMLPPSGDHFPREGRITYRWNDDAEEALAAVLDLLYFHQVLKEIPAVKLLGRD
jgi:predicted solute-binding protein